MAGSYRDLRVWQEAMQLAEVLYAASEHFPQHETYGLRNQMRRAAVSVASNIADGKGHRSDLEFGRFLFHARGSLLELETQIMLAGRLKYLKADTEEELLRITSSVARSLNALIKALKAEASGQRLTTND